MRNHLKWLQALTDGASGRSIAGASGIPVATVNRQISRGAFTAEVVIGIARAYGQSPADYTFPIKGKLKAYVQGFHGYGESLLDYNHKHNSIGFGVMLNDWDGF